MATTELHAMMYRRDMLKKKQRQGVITKAELTELKEIEAALPKPEEKKE